MTPHLQKMVRKVRDGINEPYETAVASKFWKDREIIDALWEGQSVLCAELMETYEDFFGTSKFISLSSGNGIYPLPGNFIKLRYLEYIYGGISVPIVESRKIEGAERLLNISNPQTGDQYAYAVFGEDLHIDPAPGQDLSNAVKLWYIRSLPSLVIGISPGAEATNELLLTTTQDEYGSAIDDASEVDDDYKDHYVYIWAGTGIGQKKKITAYNATTKKLTLESNWGTALDTTSKYALASMLPRDCTMLLVLHAIIALRGNRDEMALIAQERYERLHETMMDGFEQRTMATRSALPFDPWDGVLSDF